MPETLTKVEQLVDRTLDQLDPHLEELRRLENTSDLAFINGQGAFDPSLKADHYKAIRQGISTLNKRLGKSREEIAPEDLDSQARFVALRYALNRHIRLPDWQLSPGTSAPKSVPEIPGPKEVIRSSVLDTVDAVDKMVDWWSNESPYFISEERGGATVHPSRGSENVVVEPDEDRISAQFSNGVRVTLHDNNGTLSQILISSPDKTTNINLLGYRDGVEMFQGETTPEDFLDKRYEGYCFLKAPDNVPSSDIGIFAARVALEVMEADESVTRDIPTPSEEFANNTLEFLSDSLILAFGFAEYSSRISIPQLSRIRYVPAIDLSGPRNYGKNQIRQMSEADLKAVLHGIGENVITLSEKVDSSLGARRLSANLGARIDAARVHSDIDAFFSTLL